MVLGAKGVRFELFSSQESNAKPNPFVPTMTAENGVFAAWAFGAGQEGWQDAPPRTQSRAESRMDRDNNVKGSGLALSCPNISDYEAKKRYCDVECGQAAFGQQGTLTTLSDHD